MYQAYHCVPLQHDPGTTECSPGFGGGGNFLMFPQATDGAQTNNRMFSPCSRRSIRNVLQSSRSDCFSGKQFAGVHRGLYITYVF